MLRFRPLPITLYCTITATLDVNGNILSLPLMYSVEFCIYVSMRQLQYSRLSAVGCHCTCCVRRPASGQRQHATQPLRNTLPIYK